jgi:hypothetical protein
MKESAFQHKVKRRLYEQGAWIFNIHGHDMQMAGVPDLHVVSREWYGYIELKCRNNKLSRIQKAVMIDLLRRWYPVVVLRDDGTIENELGQVIYQWEWSGLLECLSKASVITVGRYKITVSEGG